jgi:DNA-binding NtrC family response regulator
LPAFAGGEIRALAEVEADMIRLALNYYDGRMALVARRLGIGRSTLYRKLREAGVTDADHDVAAE